MQGKQTKDKLASLSTILLLCCHVVRLYGGLIVQLYNLFLKIALQYTMISVMILTLKML